MNDAMRHHEMRIGWCTLRTTTIRRLMNIAVSAAGYVGFASAVGRAAIGLRGLALSAGAEDIRESPAVRLAASLKNQGE
jgi:UDP-glucose 6-dehydrogenase